MGSRRILFAWLLFMAGCVSPGDPVSSRPENHPLPEDVLRVEVQGRQGGSLHYALPGEPATFNCLMARDSRSKLVTYLTTATLLEFDAAKQRVTAGIAKEWTVSADGKTVRLHLRQGVEFSDGIPLTAQDVLFTFEKIYEAGSKNALKDSLLFGGKPLEVSSTSSHLLEIKFAEPYPAAEYILTTVPVLPRHRFEEAGKKIDEYWNLSTPAESMVGAGPFVLASHEPGRKSVFRYNPHYWKTDNQRVRLPYLDEVVIEYVEDRNTQLLRFESGQLDLLDQLLRPEDFLYLKERTQGTVQLYNAGASANLTILWCNLNTGTNPQTKKAYLSADKRRWFTNPKFRQAVSTAISRDTVVKNVYLGQARAAWSLVPPSISAWHVEDVPRYPHDPQRARALLQESGFSWQKQGAREVLVDSRGRAVQFEILTRSDSVLQKIAAVIQQDLENIGMQVTLRQEELRSVISRLMGSYAYDAAIMNLDFPIDPVDHMNVLLSSAPMHMWHPNQPQPATEWEKRIDELMLLQRSTLNLQERQRYYREVQQIVAEQAPIIPLVNRDVLIASRARLKNVRPANLFPFGLWNVWELYMEASGKGV